MIKKNYYFYDDMNGTMKMLPPPAVESLALCVWWKLWWCWLWCCEVLVMWSWEVLGGFGGGEGASGGGGGGGGGDYFDITTVARCV